MRHSLELWDYAVIVSLLLGLAWFVYLAIRAGLIP